MNNKDLLKLVQQDEELEPETIQQIYPELSSLDRQRILSLRLMLHTSGPYVDFFVFENVVLAINGLEPTVDAAEGARPEYIWYALDVAEKLLGAQPWLSDEVIAYIEFCHKDHGLKFIYPNLQVDKEYLNKVIDKAENGPFPLKEDELGIQASYYLRIQEYLNKKNS